MMFQSKLATFLGALFLAGSAFAAAGKPSVCPSITAIQAEGVIKASEILQGLYLTYNTSNYDTSDTWFFLMGPIPADSDENALAESNKIIASLSGTSSPEEDEDGDWGCEYDSGKPNIGVVAIHTQGTISPQKMNRILRRAR